jgi:hypothetical protein
MLVLFLECSPIMGMFAFSTCPLPFTVQGELLAACVEGYLLRNMKYFPKDAADEICSQWSLSWSYTREMCMEAAQLTQYSFDRNVERYVMQL